MAPPSYDTVTAMIAPALFLTATGSLILSTANRIGRIVDRIRALVDLCDQLRKGDAALDFPELRRKHARDALRRLQWRSDRASVAVTMLYLSFSAFAATSLTIAIDSVTGQHLAFLPTVLASAGVALLLGACLNLVCEARAALRSNDAEVRFFHELEALRESAKTAVE
jgi:hypothetical protein